MKILNTILLVVSLGMSPLAFASETLAEDSAAAACERVLTSHLKRWKRQAHSNLSKLTHYPIWPLQIENAPALVASALNIKPEDVTKLEGHPLQLRIEGNRLLVEIENWPKFQRAQILLRQPEVIKNFNFAPFLAEGATDPLFPLTVQANTRLFYLIRELPHETQLGLILPLREIHDQGPGHVPFFEFYLGLLKPCYSSHEETQIFTDGDGASVCVDSLVTFSTWSENFVDRYIED
jgi:hypothetical protein